MTIHSVVVHMGPLKTGSSAIAQYLSDANREGLLDPSILYPTGILWPLTTHFVTKHGNLTNILNAREMGATGAAGFESLVTTFERIRVEAESRGLPKVTTVLVAENLTPDGQPDIVVSFLRRFYDEVSLVMFCRKQDSAVSSIMSQHIKMWPQSARSTALEDHRSEGLFYGDNFDYDAAAKRWSPERSEHNLSFVPFLEGEEGTFALLERFFSVTGLSPMPDTSNMRPNRTNRALSRECLDLMCAIKVERDALATDDPRRKYLQNKFADVIGRFEFMEVAEKRGSTSFDNPWVLSRHDRRVIQEAFAPSNAAFLGAIDRTTLSQEWEAWADSVTSLMAEDESTNSAAVTQLFLDVTSLPETSYPAMRSALSIAESTGMTTLETCRYLVLDPAVGAYRIVSVEKHLEFREPSGFRAVLRRATRRQFNETRRRLRRFRALVPASARRSMRILYENSLSEARVTTTNSELSSWPVWEPRAGDAVAFLVPPASEIHRHAQALARATASEITFPSSATMSIGVDLAPSP